MLLSHPVCCGRGERDAAELKVSLQRGSCCEAGRCKGAMSGTRTAAGHSWGAFGAVSEKAL